jgi:tetratricopeptide (TPR) repeat protein
VGRDAELAQLHGWVAKALEGARQVVFVTGEPGIGKTTLVDAFLAQVGAGGWGLGSSSPAAFPPQSLAPNTQHSISNLWIARGQCVEHYGSGEAYLPVLEALGQLCRQPGREQVIALLSRYAPTWLVQMSALVSESELEGLQRKVQGATRERMLREMAEMIEALTAEQPLVLVLEDLHWSDYSTLDLLALLAQRRGPARLFLLATYRPADVIVSGHPLRAMKQELQVHGQCTEMVLRLLTGGEVSQYLAVRFPQQQFPAELASILRQSTEGNPLFLVNVVEYWVRQKVLVETGGQWRLTTKVEELAAGAPESLRQMIERQLERLTPEERRIVETASVVGGEFTAAAVAAGLAEQIERVEGWCEGLAKREQFLRSRGTETLTEGTVTGRYGFLHALYQQVLYERLAVVRRVRLHRRVGEWEERAYGGRVNEVAAELAMHFERGQDYTKAIVYHHQAGENAVRRSAHREAIAHLTQGLELLARLPDSPERTRHEINLQVTLGPALMATKGYAAPEVEQAYTRGRVLCEQREGTPHLLPVLYGLWTLYLGRGDLPAARELGEQFLSMVQRSNDPAPLLQAHFLLGDTLFWRGELDLARKHLEQSVALSGAQLHGSHTILYQVDYARVMAQSFESLVLWLLGYPDQAGRWSHAAVTLAQERHALLSLAYALTMAATLHLFRREESAAQDQAKVALSCSTEQGFPLFAAIGASVHGYLLTEQGHEEAGFAQIHRGLATWRATGAELGRTSALAFLAEAYGKHSQVEEGMNVLTEALTDAERREERFYEAELYRLKGELTLRQSRASLEQVQGTSKTKQKAKIETDPRPLIPDSQGEAEACFLKAIAIAHQQKAKSLELRAVMSLVRLRQQQATRSGSPRTQHAARTQLDEARSMLSEVYHWFTEGFDTKDLQEAKALLESLVRPAKKSRGGYLEAEARSRRGTPVR